LPVRTTPPSLSLKGKEKAVDGEDRVEKSAAEKEEERKEKTEEEVEQEKENAELSELRAILSANVAACLLKLVRLVSHPFSFSLA
jgi:translation initiation factor IF-2